MLMQGHDIPNYIINSMENGIDIQNLFYRQTHRSTAIPANWREILLPDNIIWE